jgi:hypothetical protein
MNSIYNCRTSWSRPTSHVPVARKIRHATNSHFRVQLDIEWTFHLRSGHQT